MGIKLVMLGKAYVGKTSITDRMTKNRYIHNRDSTIGSSYYQMTINNTKFDIWDTAGQERYESLTEFYFRNANIVFLVFDLTDIESIDKIKFYKKKSTNCNKVTPLFIVIGNKLDLASNKDLNKSDDLIREFFPNDCYIKVSAKENININKLTNILKNHSILENTKSKRNIYDSLEIYDYIETKDNNKCVC